MQRIQRARLIEWQHNRWWWWWCISVPSPRRLRRSTLSTRPTPRVFAASRSPPAAATRRYRLRPTTRRSRDIERRCSCASVLPPATVTCQRARPVVRRCPARPPSASVNGSRSRLSSAAEVRRGLSSRRLGFFADALVTFPRRWVDLSLSLSHFSL